MDQAEREIYRMLFDGQPDNCTIKAPWGGTLTREKRKGKFYVMWKPGSPIDQIVITA